MAILVRVDADHPRLTRKNESRTPLTARQLLRRSRRIAFANEQWFRSYGSSSSGGGSPREVLVGPAVVAAAAASGALECGLEHTYNLGRCRRYALKGKTYFIERKTGDAYKAAR